MSNDPSRKKKVEAILTWMEHWSLEEDEHGYLIGFFVDDVYHFEWQELLHDRVLWHLVEREIQDHELMEEYILNLIGELNTQQSPPISQKQQAIELRLASPEDCLDAVVKLEPIREILDSLQEVVDVRGCPFCGKIVRFDPTNIQMEIKPCCNKARKVRNDAYKLIMEGMENE